MKYSLPTTLLLLTVMTMTVSSSGLRGLQAINVQGSNILAPSVKISGISTLLQILNSATEFTNSTFDVLTLDSFSQSVTDQGVAVDAKVTIANDQGFNVSGVINGTWDPSSGNINFDVAGVETSESNGEGEETNTTSPIPVPNGYTWLSAEDLANNELASNALPWGVNALVAKAISQYKLPAAEPEYNVTNLILAAYKNASYGSAYIFWTNLSNSLNYKMDANITIKYWKSTQTYTLAGYSFHSYGYPASAIVRPPPVNNTNSTNNATDNSTVPDNSTVVDNSTVPDNSTQPVDNSTVIDPSNNSTNVTVPDNATVVDNNSTSNATEPANNTTAPVNLTHDGYTILSADQLAQDALASAALQYGAIALIQKGISQNKIPAANANYTINNINIAAYKKVVLGTYYKFQVNMTNADYVHVDANLTILYRYSTKAYSLNGYWFHSYNYSSKALSNSNNASTNATVPVNNSNSTVVDNGSAANNATSSDPITAPVDNSTVIDPSAPVSGDNSTVVDNGSTDAIVVDDSANSGSR